MYDPQISNINCNKTYYHYYLPQLIYYLLELNSFHILFQHLPDEISVEESRTNVTDRSDHKYQTISPQGPDSSQHGNKSTGDSNVLGVPSQFDISGHDKGHSDPFKCPPYDPKLEVLYL